MSPYPSFPRGASSRTSEQAGVSKIWRMSNGWNKWAKTNRRLVCGLAGTEQGGFGALERLSGLADLTPGLRLGLCSCVPNFPPRSARIQQ